MCSAFAPLTEQWGGLIQNVIYRIKGHYYAEPIAIAQRTAFIPAILTFQFGSTHYGNTSRFVTVALQRQTAYQPLPATF